MNSQQHDDAQLKLEAYKAATNACSSGRNTYMGCPGPTVSDITTEAERLWVWMTKPTEAAK